MTPIRGGDLDREVSIRGLLTAIDWSSDDSVRRVALFTSDEDEYNIDIDEDNRGLLDHLRQEVIVTGFVVAGAQGRKAFRVRSFEASRS